VRLAPRWSSVDILLLGEGAGERCGVCLGEGSSRM